MFASPSISVCVPAYGMDGHGCAFLDHSLKVLSDQDFQDFEVVVADQSEDDAIRTLCSEYPGLNIRHVPTGHLKRQASANTNAAIENSHGAVIKVLFQDDFLNGRDALTKIADAFEDPEVGWCLTGSEHSRDGTTLIRPFVPRYHDRIHYGKNTVSSPSVLAFRRQKALRFDENLIWLMDVDFYKQCALKWGPPPTLPEPLAVNRLHDGQVSAGVDSDLVRRELRYIHRKYGPDESWSDWLHYLGRLRKTYI